MIKSSPLEYGFIVFSIKNTIFWCMFIVFISINGIIQGINSIIELSFFTVFYIDKMTTLKWPEWPPLKWPVHSVIFSVHEIFKKLLKNILIKDEFIFEKYNFKIIQCCISTHGSNTRCTHRKTAEHTWNCFFIV